MEVGEEKIDTNNISVGVCLWFCRLDVVLNALDALKLYGCDCLGFRSVEKCILLPHWELTVRTQANCPRRRICMDNSNSSK